VTQPTQQTWPYSDSFWSLPWIQWTVIKETPMYVCRVKYWKTVVSGNEENSRTWYILLSMQKP
jgi:hypothetical protein